MKWTWAAIAELGVLGVLSALATPGCSPSGGQVGSGGTVPGASLLGGGTTFGSGTGTGTTTSGIQAFKNAGSVKVIFNKASFYTNQNPNPSACAGDARYFYSPITDRKVPVKPDWLKNVALDLTNSNAQKGPSRAVGCSLTGLGSSDPSNCASFDDLQPLNGETSRSVMIGGYGCKTGTTSCSQTHVLGDIWNLIATDLATSTVWGPQSSGIPATGGAGTLPGLVWHAGDFDEIHNLFYIFGGATPNLAATDSTLTFSNQVVKVTFNPDSSVSASPQPELMNVSTQRFYVGWAKAAPFNTALAPFFPPPPMVGTNFTYSARRHPQLKSQCRDGDSLGAWTCTADVASTNINVAVNEHQDYYLLTGGMTTAGQFSTRFYAYKPHGFSREANTTAVPTQTNGDWTLLSNVLGQVATSNQVMSVVDIQYVDSSTTIAPVVITDVGSARYGSTTDIFSGWLGRGYHRTAYDPGMNRYYIFGGLQNRGVAIGTPISASTLSPDLATTDLWIYDPPALGRRPTSACFTNLTPDNVSLPAASAVGTTRNLGVNREYLATNFVFPPGGCLQRFMLDTTPPARFEHSMAFDRDNKALLVFGGCKQSAVIRPPGNVQAGDPTLSCTSAGALLNDTWVYLPPETTEYVSKDYRSPTGKVSPYNASTLLANVFTTDFWIDHFPMFEGDNSPSNASITMPREDQLVGTWISLAPAIKPPPRVGGSLVYDRAHNKYFLQGGFGCIDTQCSTSPKALNDLWAFTPPDFKDPTQCTRSAGSCTSLTQGVWTKVRVDKEDSNSDQPTQRKGAVLAYANPAFTYADEFYSVRDSSCINQGPIASTDSSVNKRLVGAIYIDVDRSVLAPTDNIVINLRFLPFDKNTKAPGFFDNNTPNVAVDDTDTNGSQDTALVRVQLLANQLKFAEQIQATVQPRYHEYISGTPVLGDAFMYVAGGTGQVTEKQIHIPLAADPSINLIKIERVEGSMKFFEMTISKF